MIVVFLKFKKSVTQYEFSSLTEALIFARSKEEGTSFQIKEGQIILATGKIENLKERFV